MKALVRSVILTALGTDSKKRVRSPMTHKNLDLEDSLLLVSVFPLVPSGNNPFTGEIARFISLADPRQGH